MIVPPPVSVGATNDNDAESCNGSATTSVGAPAGYTTTNGADAADGTESPTPLVATTVNVYVAPAVKPDTTHDVGTGGATGPTTHDFDGASTDVTVYPVNAKPPSLTGAVHDTAACPATPVNTPATPVGAPGTVPTTTGPDGAETVPGPTLLVACTVNVYVLPGVKPDITHEVTGGVPVTSHGAGATPPSTGIACTVYIEICAPPSEDGATHDTVTCPAPDTEPDTDVGAPGTVAPDVINGTGAPTVVPPALVAETAKKYIVEGVNPTTGADTITGEEPPTEEGVTGVAGVPPPEEIISMFVLYLIEISDVGEPIGFTVPPKLADVAVTEVAAGPLTTTGAAGDVVNDRVDPFVVPTMLVADTR